ncbi:HNH endonuclease [Halobaculum sp. MBLA0147]|uniref:HNH endonuclease n=1 Tax=Halobaculum sp. MBLA0147 TaxID=3079934 RepID=UPI003523A31E
MSDAADTDSDPVDQSEATDQIETEQSQLPDDRRNSALTRDNYRCRACNQQDRQRGGAVTLQVHHREDDPDHCQYHDLQNLTTLCPRCHRWLHRQPDSTDLPDPIQGRLDGADLEPTWIAILQFLADHGSATTSTITEHTELSTDNGTRNALYGLMAADQEKPGVTGRLVAKDRFTNEYGLPWQIPDDHDARGVIPVSEAERRGRLLDEFVRRVDEHLPDSVSDREEILAAIVNRHAKHVDSLRRRGEAFQFPFEEWADTEGRSPSTRRQRTVEAVATLADVTDVSAEVLVGVITEVLAAESEDDLVDALQSWVEADQPGQTSLDDPPFGDPPSEEPDSPQRPTGFDHHAESPDGPPEEQPHDE